MIFPQLSGGKPWRYRSLKIPLRLVLTVPFVLLTVGTSGLVGYLSWQNGQRSVSRLANQLIEEVQHRTENHIRSYLETAPLANANNANAIGLNSPNFADLEQYLCRQLQLYRTMTAMHLSDPQGNFIGIVRDSNGQLAVHERKVALDRAVRAVALNQQCRRSQALASPGGFDPRDRPWYQAAVRAKQAVWSPIFAWKASPVIGTNAALPVYDASGKLSYVLGTSLVLSDISQYLRTLKIGRSGQVFIVERNGLFVASSTAEDPFVANQNEPPKRRSVFGSDAALLKASAAYIQQHYNGFENITQPQQFVAQFDRSTYFLRVMPLADPRGIDWLMLVIVPESDFMEQINANTQTTLFLSAGALLGSILVGLWLTRSIVRPIQHLGRVSFALANGDWNPETKRTSPIAELQVLDRSFDSMANQIQQSFDRIKTALQESEEKFTLIFRTSPDPIAIVSSDWKYLEVNDAFVQVSEYSRNEIIGRTSAELKFWINLDERDQYLQLLQVEGQVRNEEVYFRARSGRHLIMLVSIEKVELQGQTSFVVVAKEISDRKQLELDLQQSQARLNDILSSAITAICRFRINAQRQINYEYFSSSNVAVFGYTPEELAADPALWQSRLHPDDREQVLLKMPPDADQGSFSTEYRFYHKDGTIRWILDSVKFRRDETQQGWIVTGVAIDNTARKQAEQALSKSEATKNQILKAIPDLIIWMSADGTCLEFINSDSVPKLYVKLEESGKNSYRLLPPDLAQLRMNAIEQARNSGEVIVYEQQLQLSGSIRYEEVRVVSVSDDRILVIVRDISKRHRAEEALLNSEERFRSAFEGAAIGMALIGLDTRWLKVNPVLCEMLGYAEDHLLKMSVTAFVYPDDLDSLRQFVQQARLNERHTVQMQLRYYRSDRRLAWGRLSLSVVRDLHQPLYYVVQIQDITQQQAIDRMKNEFISVVSHELRTPLTAIQGCLGLLETGVYDQRPDKAKRMLNLALMNSDRLVRLVNDILDLERLDSGRVELIKEKCDAQALMQRAVEGVSTIADQNGVLLSIQPTQLKVWAAPDAIIQTLTNLLSNAIKFSAPNSVVSVSVYAQPDAVQFQVKDQGRGIPADKLETIFGRFQQVDVSDSRQKKGTGLGLSICQSIVQQHGGNIWAESILGHGSTFCFTLPNSSESRHD